MGHHGRRLSEQSVATIGIAVAECVRLQLMHSRHLREVLRQMRLNGQPIAAGQFAASLQHGRRTGRDETRGDDGAYQGLRIGILRSQLLHAADSLIHRLDKAVRTVAVHRHLTHQRPHARLAEESHQTARSLRMDCGKDSGTHRTHTTQMADEAAVNAFGIVSVSKLRLLGKGVMLQPG